MATHITLLKPGKRHHYPESDILIELSPARCDSLETDRQYMQEAVGESPDIVISHIVLDLPEKIEDRLEELRAQDGPEMIECILTAAFNLGRAYQG